MVSVSQPDSPPPNASSAEAASGYLTAAVAIARELAQAALPAASGLTWETDDLAGDMEHHVVVRTRCGADVYGGAAGIAWFLGHIAPYDPAGGFADVAVQALHFAIAEALEHLEQEEPSLLT